MDRTELAWAAGFFDAEGWAGAVKHRDGTWPVAQINQAGAFGVPEVLERFHAAVGIGRIGGPQCAPGKLDLYRWVASSRADVVRTVTTLAPWLGLVKAEQFALAVGPVSFEETAVAPEEPLAWAAGLFDGDGSTYFERHKTHAGYVRAEMAVTQSSRCGVPAVLARFRKVVDAGRIGGPFGGNDTRQPVYRWKVHRLAEAEAIARALWPWLGAVKRVQATKVIATVAAQPPLPRGNPAWGRSHKTHCVHGHEYATARIRPYRSRSVGTTERRASKQCLACVREWARRQYAEKKARRPK